MAFTYLPMAPTRITAVPDDLFTDIGAYDPVPAELESIFPFASPDVLGDLYADAMAGNRQQQSEGDLPGCPNLGPLGEMMGFPYHCQAGTEQETRDWNAKHPPAAGLTAPYASDLMAAVLRSSAPMPPSAPAYPGVGSGLLDLWT